MTPAPTEIIKKPVTWAKASPWVFGIFLLLVVMLVIRFRDKIAAFFGKAASWPLIGRPIAWLTGVNGTSQGAPPAAAT